MSYDISLIEFPSFSDQEIDEVVKEADRITCIEDDIRQFRKSQCSKLLIDGLDEIIEIAKKVKEKISPKVCVVDDHCDGGTYNVFGSIAAELSITSNYNVIYLEIAKITLKEMLDGRKAVDVIPILEDTINKLGIEQDTNYWKPTPGNAGYALSILLKWAKQHPNAHFSVS
jgi:hypothetical protein